MGEDRFDLVRNRAVRRVEPLGKQRKIGLVARLEIGGNQIVLALEMIVQCPLCELRRFRNGIHADSANALRIEQAAGSIENAVTGRVGCLWHGEKVY